MTNEKKTLICVAGYVAKPMHSAAGWYWGTVDKDGLPNCRCSNNYYKTEEECIKAMNIVKLFPRECEDAESATGGIRHCFINLIEEEEKQYEHDDL